MRTVIQKMVLVVALGGLGVGYAAWPTTLVADTMVKTGNVSIDFPDAVCSDPPGTPDSGSDKLGKDVGWCEIATPSKELLITVYQAYPSYSAVVDVTVAGNGTVPVHIIATALVTSSPQLTLEGFWTDNNLVCEQLHNADSVTGKLWFHVLQPAPQSWTLSFQIEITAAQWNETSCPPGVQDLGGTPGFWKNWDAHNTYTEAEILAFLTAVSSTSSWLGPESIAGMIAMFNDNSTAETKFLRHYLATKLNIAASRLDTTYGWNWPGKIGLCSKRCLA